MQGKAVACVKLLYIVVHRVRNMYFSSIPSTYLHATL